MRFGILGPLLTYDDAGVGHTVPVAQHRLLLAVLLLRANQAISFDELADAMWDGDPPPGARATLRNYVRLLRRSLGPELAARVITRAPGYLIQVGDDELDLFLFTRLSRRGRDAVRARAWDDAHDHLAAALALWRGSAFADVSSRAVEQTHAPHLDALRLQTVEWRIEADLQLGRHDEVLGELRRLTGEHPLKERFWEQLMVTLYRVGQQGDALAAYADVRQILDRELGLQPGPSLQAVQRRILAADPSLLPERPSTPPPAAPSTPSAPSAAPSAPVPGRTAPGGTPTPAQLPLDVRGFAGRDTDLARLDAVMAEAKNRPSTVAVCAVSGTAGVGKTALAVHWAHRVAGQFPDGQLYVNLRGFDPAAVPVPAQDALRTMLEALGVTPRRLPAGLAAQAALYRSLLAGRRMLVVLDNALDEDHVRPLLPGSPGCLVVVTSRQRLQGLVATEAAHSLALDVLDAEGARQLLVERIGADRTAAEPSAVTDLIERCARLPLALAVVAARAVTHPHFPLRTLADDLHRTRSALDALDGPDLVSDVRAVFSSSYRALTAAARRMFRLLGVHPGPHITLTAAASLSAVPVEHARSLLAELTHAHMLTEDHPGLYAFHDLLRAYAAELTLTEEPHDERRHALHRSMDHYLHTAAAASLLLRPHRDRLTLPDPLPGVGAEDIADRDAALAWYTAQHPVLLGLIALAEDAGLDEHIWKLAWACSEYLERQGKWDIQVSVQQAALSAAQRSGDRTGLTHAHRSLGMGYARLLRFDQANVHLDHALTASGQLGDHHAQARIHNNTGWVLELQGRYVEAIDHARQALDLYRATGHHSGQANALNNIGWYQALNGDYAAAIVNCQQALAIHAAIDDRIAQAATYDSIGYAHYRLGDHGAAELAYLEAIRLSQESGNLYQAAATQTSLGDVYLADGNDSSARQVWHQALATLEGLGHPDAADVRARIGAVDVDA